MSYYARPQPHTAAELVRRLDENVLRTAHDYKAGHWISTLQYLLGMSNDELAAELGRNQSSISRLRSAEERGTITLDSLTRVADALGATLVYALVPNSDFVDCCQSRHDNLKRLEKAHRRLKPAQVRSIKRANQRKASRKAA